MRSITATVLLFCWAAPLCAQALPQIIGVHMHALAVGARYPADSAGTDGSAEAR
jgi:hypothetical protein